MILLWFLLYFVYASEFTTEFTSERFMNAEARIIDKILANYNTEVRPSVNGTGQPIEVTSFTKIKTQTICFLSLFSIKSENFTKINLVLNFSKARIIVTIAVNLMMVLEVDEKEEQMVTTAYTTQRFKKYIYVI